MKRLAHQLLALLLIILVLTGCTPKSYKSSYEVTYEVWDTTGLTEPRKGNPSINVDVYYNNATGGSVSDTCRSRTINYEGEVYGGMPCRYTFTMRRGQFAYMSASSGDGIHTVCRILVDGLPWRFSESIGGNYRTVSCSGYLGQP